MNRQPATQEGTSLDEKWMHAAYRLGYEHARDGLPPRVPLRPPQPPQPVAAVIDMREWTALRNANLNR